MNLLKGEKLFGGKEVKKGGKWYPITIVAKSLKEANEKIKNSRDEIRGRFEIIEEGWL